MNIDKYKEKLIEFFLKSAFLYILIEVIILFYVPIIYIFIENRNIKKFVLIILLLLFFLFWMIRFLIVKEKFKYFKSDSEKVSICKAFSKSFLQFLIYIHISLVLNFLEDNKVSIFLIIFLILFYISFFNNIINLMFRTNYSTCILIIELICFYLLGKSKFIVILITFGGYYLVNWLSSRDSLYYFSKKYGMKIKFYTQVFSPRWAIQKAKIMFIVISTNIVFAIKDMLPNEWKNIILAKIIDLFNIIIDLFNIIIGLLSSLLPVVKILNSPLSNKDSEMYKSTIISILILSSITAIYYILIKFILDKPKKSNFNIPFLSKMVNLQIEEVNMLRNAKNIRIKRVRTNKKRKIRRDKKKLNNE